MQETSNEINKKATLLEQQIKNKSDTLAREENELKQLNDTLKRNKALLKRKEKESKDIEANFANVNKQREYLENRIETLQASLLGINDNSNNENGDNSGSLRQQLISAKKGCSKIQTQLKTNNNRTKSIKKEVKNEQKKAEKCNRNFERMRLEKEAKEAQLAQKQQELQVMFFIFLFLFLLSLVLFAIIVCIFCFCVCLCMFFLPFLLFFCRRLDLMRRNKKNWKQSFKMKWKESNSWSMK